MPRSRRHVTSSDPLRSAEDYYRSIGPSPSLPPLLIDAQEHQEAPVQQTVVETTKPKVIRGHKRSSRLWDVGVRGENGEVRQKKMRAIDIFSLPPGDKIIVEWNSRDQPVELSGGMLAQFLGHLVSNCHNFPLGYEKWQKIPESCKDHVWNNIIKTKLEVNDEGHKSYIMKSLGKKLRDHWYHLYNSMKCDPDGPREANIAKKPPEIPLDQWVAFVDYRARPNTKAKVEKNTINDTNLTTSHMLGSKSFARPRNEMETQLGQPVTRAELFQASHTTSTGSFIIEEARRNHEDLVIRSHSSYENETFSSIFRKEHPGYVRGMGLGVVPTQMYGSSSSSGSRRDGGGVTVAEHNALMYKVQCLVQQLEETKQQVAFLTQRMTGQNQNVTHNQENVGFPAVEMSSSQGSHSAHGEENSDHTT